MTEIFPDQGLDLIMDVVPKGGTTIADMYIGLFTSQTASTVLARTEDETDITEPSAGAYARQNVAASDWGANATSGNGRKSTNSQITFPTATAAWGTINGFFLNTGCENGSIVYAANFDDVDPITVNTNDVVKVTPGWQADN